MASRNKGLSQIPLGSVGEFRMYGLTLPGMEDAWDPNSQVCLPVETAVKLLLRIFAALWKLNKKTQAQLLKVSPHPGTLPPWRLRPASAGATSSDRGLIALLHDSACPLPT